MAERMTQEVPADFKGHIVLRVGQSDSAVLAVEDASPDGGSPAQPDPSFEEMFKRYTAASPCRQLAAALSAAGWAGAVAKTTDSTKRSQPYIRWERARPNDKPLVIYQHSKKLATATGTPTDAAFYADYATEGVTKTIDALTAFVHKMA